MIRIIIIILEVTQRPLGLPDPSFENPGYKEAFIPLFFFISWEMTAKAVLWADSEESSQSVFIRLMYISWTPLTFSCLMTLAFTQAPHQHFTLRRQYKQHPWLTARLSPLHNSSYLGTVISVIITQPLFIIRDEALETAEGQTITEQWQGLPLLWWKHTRWELPAVTGKKKERMDKLLSRKLFGKSFRDDCRQWRQSEMVGGGWFMRFSNMLENYFSYFLLIILE